MKNLKVFGIAAFLLIWVLSACGVAQSAVEKEKMASDVQNAVEMRDFEFKATYAYPTGYKSIYLSPFYDVKVSADTVKAYLPFYGRAYRAPMDSREGGYRFTSTDFEYQAEKGKKKGSWDITITFHDLNRPVTFNFDIWENGKAHLNVSDTDRQPISFQGELVLNDEE